MEELLANKSRDVSWPTRIRLACDVAKGVKYLHSRNVMHRDLTSKVCLSVCLSVCLCRSVLYFVFVACYCLYGLCTEHNAVSCKWDLAWLSM